MSNTVDIETLGVSEVILSYPSYATSCPARMNADFTSDNTSVGVNTPIQFTDTSTLAPTSWVWDFGDGTTSNAQNPLKTYSVEGTYNVKLIAANSNGQGDVEIKNSYISITPDLTKMTADFTEDKSTVSNGELIQFTDSTTLSPDSWLWDFGDGTISTLQNPTKRYYKAGVFSVSLRVSKSGGLGDIITKTNLITSTITTTKSALFDGVNDFGLIDMSKFGLNNSLANQKLSFTCWIKPISLSSDRGIVYGGNSSTAIFYFNLGNTGTVTRGNLAVRAGVSLVNCSSDSFWDIGVWAHCACVINGPEQKLYLNGVLVGLSTSLVFSSMDLSEAGVGRRIVGASAAYFNANLTELAFYKKDLSDAEVLESYNSGSANFDHISSSMGDDLIHWYRFGNSDEDFFPIIKDIINDADITLFNMSSGQIVTEAP